MSVSKIIDNQYESFLSNAILIRDENEQLEFKRMNKKPAELLESVVAFSNSKGGILVLGVEDFKKAKGYNRLLGISEGMDNYSEFKTLLYRHIQPNISNDVHLQEINIINTKNEEDKIVLISVDASNDVCSTISGDTYIRKGNSNRKIGNQEIIRLKYEKGSLKYEDEITTIDKLDNFNYELFQNFKNSISSGNDNDWQILKDNGLAEEKGGKMFLRKSAVLLFSKNPSVTLSSKCSIKISHYYGTFEEFSGEPNFRSRPFSIEGPLFEQIRKTIDFFKGLVKLAPPILVDGQFKSPFIIPERVFQEAITNAVIHRNYAIQNDIQVRIFDDHIEVESPGCYPGHITPYNIKEERFARNPILLRSLNRFYDAPNLDIGEGVDRMFKVMEENNLYDPRYSLVNEKPHSVMVSLFNLHRIEYWDSIKNFIHENGSISNQEARNIIGIYDTLKMTRILQELVKNKLLVSEGNKRFTRYKFPDNAFIIRNSIFKGDENRKK